MDLISFCHRWLEKADQYDVLTVAGAYDAFWSAFVAYNALYVEIARQLVAQGHIAPSATGDKQSATVHVPRFIGHSSLAALMRVNDATQRAIDEFSSLIEDDSFYVHCDSAGRPRHEDDRSCLKRIKAGTDQEYCESILALIYKTRCNLFHGSKQFDRAQVAFLNPMTQVLRHVIDIIIARLQPTPTGP